MDSLQAFLLGLVQGLTEYLPISSSGHLILASHLFGVEDSDNLAFTILVHVATVLSTVVILRREIAWIITDLLKFQMNEGTRYALCILISMIPIGIVGVFFKDVVEDIFGSGLLIVGLMLLLTAILLTFTHFARPRQKEKIGLPQAFVIGLAQACAVMPGLSRSGSTIAIGLLLGCRKEQMAQFSFLMVIPPILGEALLDGIKLIRGGVEAIATSIPTSSMIIGFLSAFVFGCLACKFMIGVVRRGKLIYFAAYCFIVGALVCLLA